MVDALFPLKIEQAIVKKRGKRIIGPIDLELNEGGISAIIGPNGSGKTTLLRMLHGIEPIFEGNLAWGDYQGVNLKSALSQQAFVFQNPIMLRRSVLENLIYPLLLKKIPKREAIKSADEWLERVELTGSRNQDALVLSGGERQKLAIARALACRPKILFLDEPTSNLDGHSMMAVENLILDAKKAGVKIMLATHDFGQLRRLADDVIFILNGRVHEMGDAGTLLAKANKQETINFLNGEIVL